MDGFQLLGAQSTQDKAIALTTEAATAIWVSRAAGAVIGATALASLWRSHRVIGGLLGFFFLGPAVGSVVGIAIAASKMKSLAALSKAKS